MGQDRRRSGSQPLEWLGRTSSTGGSQSLEPVGSITGIHRLAELHVDTGPDWDGCVWLERLEDISEGSLAQMLYAEDVDVESAVIRWLSRR